MHAAWPFAVLFWLASARQVFLAEPPANQISPESIHMRSLADLKAPDRDLPSWQQKASPLLRTSSSQTATTKHLSPDDSPSPVRLEERIDAARLQAAHETSPTITLGSSPADVRGQLGIDTPADGIQGLRETVPEGNRQTHREVQLTPDAGHQLQQAGQLQDNAQAQQKVQVIPDAGHQAQDKADADQSLRHAAVQMQQARLHGVIADEDLGVKNPDQPRADVSSSPDSKRQLAGTTTGQRRVDAEGVEVVVDSIGTLTVLAMTLGMAGVSAIGALPFFFVGSLSKEWTGLANAIACGVMLAASFDLVHEGQPYGGHLVILGVIVGALFIKASQEWLEQFEDVKFEGLQGAGARKTLLVVGIMAAHGLGEGCGVGVSFCGARGWAQGTLVTLAIGLHNIPEGLAVATVLVARGVSPRQAALWSVATSLPQPLLAVPSFLFVDTFRALLPIGLGFACGCMVWIVFAELLPDALEAAPAGKVATSATFSAGWLEGLRMVLAKLEEPGGRLVLPSLADLRLPLSTLSLLLPTTLPAGLLGWWVGSQRLPVPNLTGMAAGICAVAGLGDLLSLVLWHPHSSILPTLLWAATGAALAHLAWRFQMSLSPGSHKAGKDGLRTSSSGTSLAAQPAAATLWPHPNPLDLEAGARKGEQSGADGGSTSAWLRADSWELLNRAEGHGGSMGGQLPGVQRPGDAPLHQRSHQPSSMTAAAAAVGTVHSGTGPTSLGPDHPSKPSLPRSSGGPTHPLTCAAGIAGTALAAQGVSMGLGAAHLVLMTGGVTATVFPLVLLAALQGIAAACLAGPLLGSSPHLAAMAAVAGAAVPPVTAALVIWQSGPGMLQGQLSHLAAFQHSRSATILAALAAGGMLTVGWGMLWPLAQQMTRGAVGSRRRAASQGTLAGTALTACAYGLLGFGCILTTSCLSS
ncbi:hypothetical protein WJX74_003025 [Apatococcus lobatus]|uniref:Zinc transporter n=1 Tax=Apatococcus lobatus TaxID=904363 RepID=A0AAW1SFZ7_9CHLO